GQAALLAHLAEETGRGRAAEDRVEHAERVAPLIPAVDAGASEGDVELLGVLPLEADPGSVELRGLATGRVAAARRWLNVTLGQLDDPVVLEVPSRRHDDVRARVAGPVVGVDLRNRDRADHLGLAQHAAP